MILLTLST